MNCRPDSWNSRILLVDDDDRIHGLFRRILKAPSCRTPPQEGALASDVSAFEMHSAFQGVQALERVQAACAAGRPFAVVFMDMEMPPGWDGIQTIERVRQVDPGVEVAICTGHWTDQRECRLRAVERSQDITVVSKPFHNGEIHQLASKLVSKWNKAHQFVADSAILPAALSPPSLCCT